MKDVSIIVTYTATVPDDTDLAKLEEKAQEEIESRLEYMGLEFENDDDYQCHEFSLDKVRAATSYTLSTSIA